LHGAPAQKQRLADFPIRPARDEQAQDFGLTSREPASLRGLGRPLRHRDSQRQRHRLIEAQLPTRLIPRLKPVLAESGSRAIRRRGTGGAGRWPQGHPGPDLPAVCRAQQHGGVVVPPEFRRDPRQVAQRVEQEIAVVDASPPWEERRPVHRAVRLGGPARIGADPQAQPFLVGRHRGLDIATVMGNFGDELERAGDA
jgi:hypothetical protein